MNPALKFFISFLLQYPLYYVIGNGLITLTGLAWSWAILISVALVLMYDLGEIIRKDNWED